VFSGIIEKLGRVSRIEKTQQGARLTIEAPGFGRLKTGESVSTNGVCLTVVEQSGDSLAYDLSLETLKRTTLGDLREGDLINLERALAVGDRLGGHFVAGHVDGIGRISVIRPQGQGSEIVFEAPEQVIRFVADKASVAVEGVSLTPFEVKGSCFTVAFIPHTLKQTNLGQKKVGDAVNLEIDILARYVGRLLEEGRQP
jgi:riboflavin synthase